MTNENGSNPDFKEGSVPQTTEQPLGELATLVATEPTTVDSEIMEFAQRRRKEILAGRALDGLGCVGPPKEGAVATVDSTAEYLASIGDFELMTKAEEGELGRIIQGATRALESPDLEATQREELITQRGQAINKMVQRNTRLAVSIARRHLNSSVEMLDLIQAGNMGLIRAAEKFDPELGFKFSTYATWWIRRFIQTETANFRLGVMNLRDTEKKLLRRLASLEQEVSREGEPLDVNELSQALGISEDKVEELLARKWTLDSLDRPLGENGKEVLAGIVVNKGALGSSSVVEDEATDSVLADQIRGIMSRALNEEQLDILERRFGFNGHSAQTLESIGKAHGISSSSVRLRIIGAIEAIKPQLITSRILVDAE